MEGQQVGGWTDGWIDGWTERKVVNRSTFHKGSYCLLIKQSAGGFTDIPGVSNNVIQEC